MMQDGYKYEYDSALMLVRSQPDIKETVLRLLRARYELCKEQVVDHPELALAAYELREVIADLRAPEFRKPDRADG